MDKVVTVKEFGAIICSVVMTVGGLIIFTFTWLKKNLNEYNIRKEIWVNIVIVETVVILLLILIIIFCVLRLHSLKKTRVQNLDKIIDSNYIADLEFYKVYISKVLMPEKVQQQDKLYKDISVGFFQINGEDVKRHQTKMMGMFNAGETICAIDLTNHPDRLLDQSRVRYNLENKEFIKKGGAIKRLFILKSSKLKDGKSTYAKDFYKVLRMNQDYGVKTGILLDMWLGADKKRDVIIYSDKSCILEGIQLSVKDGEGYSLLSFLKSEIDDMQNIFDELWDFPINPQELSKSFLDCYSVDINSREASIIKENYDVFLKIIQSAKENDSEKI